MKLHSKEECLSKYEAYFEGKSLIEIVEFIKSTRDINSNNFDLEDDNIYPLYRFFNWSDIYDHFSCFLIPYKDHLYLTFHFWEKQYSINPEYQFIEITKSEIVEILEKLLKRIESL